MLRGPALPEVPEHSARLDLRVPCPRPESGRGREVGSKQVQMQTEEQADAERFYSYLKKLQAISQDEAQSDGHVAVSHTDESQTTVALQSRPPSHPPSADREIANPLKQSRSLSHQHFVGESTCAVFANRLLQCLQPEGTSTSTLPEQHYVKRPEFTRQVGNPYSCKFPDRIRATLLVRVALRFIGQDYHFFLQKEFLQQLEKAYASKDTQDADPAWACKFFVVLALGELYSTTLPSNPPSVPGTDYFVSAVNLLQDLYEEPSVTQIETMLLFCFYSNALGRVKSAHVYSGLAVRFSTCLGLHRDPPEDLDLTAVEVEHRVRLWWTAYIFDRSTSSRLGQPLTIQDEDIDVRLPSSDHLSPEDQAKLGSPAHLCANIELARITGSIMRDIYSPSSALRGSFLHNVRTILKSLRKWDANVAPSLRLSQGPANRPLTSLQLHFNQCIILTTRPVLLHVLKTKNPFGEPNANPNANAALNDGPAAEPLSETATMLAESCISAARTSNGILSQLYVENALALFGHFDAHYLFASTLVLIISAIISPNSSDSDAVQTAFHLLRTMRDSGNVSAAQFYPRLSHIQWSIGRLRGRVTARHEASVANAQQTDSSAQALDAPELPPLGSSDFENYDWDDFAVPDANFASYDWTGLGRVTVDPLDNPMLQTFLDHADATWDENIGIIVGDMT
ncbi:hypothetical protein A1O3_08426 [Capronia epimyces CBS 606.96]|uniref:Xylanolytic transcriptional activator regulatory domain-containing protein n=1 Tax=Capronia epimyces CBS 606.96 TaxID=1182542 RepID=W9XPP3_9EURO|nr:uncharacterized protein A1O3_08426 [Capronia epimyces CBS 606.96]EXJ78926.1 hypothetical protein A1O3_08426 [Capronia epimyces CBS 606.96]